MSTDTPTGTPSPQEGDPNPFRDFIEERYQEWESEFGDDVHVRRTVSFDPKK
jgi:hypothetical protein